MKTTKKVLALAIVAAMTVVGFVTSTYSWYTHNSASQGKKINYHNDSLPISVKSAASTITMSTFTSDANGVATNTAVSSISLAADASTQKAIQYYKTVFTNAGSNDVYLDFSTSNLPNNADFVIGTLSPTLNEKAYASRAVRTKATGSTVRVYFKTNSGYSSFWSTDNGTLNPNNSVGSSNGTTNDINIAYTVNGTESMKKMTLCSTRDTTTSDSGTNKVYYYDIPSNTTSFYFFNHWYLCSGTNREWNRTLDITDLTAGKLYYLNGSQVDGKYKAYTAREVDTDLVALSSYYSYVRMSMGNSVFADIGLKKSSDDEDFIPEYYGAAIAYSSSDTSVASVNKDGLITPVAQGNATITTRITGKYGDYKEITTSVEIPQNINQVPVITNVKIPAAADGSLGRVEIDWYALNKSASATMTTGTLFYTI